MFIRFPAILLVKTIEFVHGVFYIAIFSNMAQRQKARYRVAHYVIVNNVTTATLESKTKNAWKRRWQKRNRNRLNRFYLSVSDSFKDGISKLNNHSTMVVGKLILFLRTHGFKDPRVISERLGQELESCSKWLVDNKLSLHLGKTESILFGSKRKLKKIKDFFVTCNGQTINNQEAVKYLGVMLDQELSGEAIANEVIKKVNARLRFMYRQGYFLTSSMRKTLCNSLIQCHFDYACSSWYSSLSKYFQKRLQVTQNKVVRFINKYNPRRSVRSTDLSKLGMLNVEHRVKQMRLNHVYRIYNNCCPEYMRDNFIQVYEVHSYSTRHSLHNFKVPSVNNIIKSTFYYNAVQDWNQLPENIKNKKTLYGFRKEIKSFLNSLQIQKENSEWVM